MVQEAEREDSGDYGEEYEEDEEQPMQEGQLPQVEPEYASDESGDNADAEE